METPVLSGTITARIKAKAPPSEGIRSAAEWHKSLFNRFCDLSDGRVGKADGGAKQQWGDIVDTRRGEYA